MKPITVFVCGLMLATPLRALEAARLRVPVSRISLPAVAGWQASPGQPCVVKGDSCIEFIERSRTLDPRTLEEYLDNFRINGPVLSREPLQCGPLTGGLVHCRINAPVAEKDTPRHADQLHAAFVTADRLVVVQGQIPPDSPPGILAEMRRMISELRWDPLEPYDPFAAFPCRIDPLSNYDLSIILPDSVRFRGIGYDTGNISVHFSPGPIRTASERRTRCVEDALGYLGHRDPPSSKPARPDSDKGVLREIHPVQLDGIDGYMIQGERERTTHMFVTLFDQNGIYHIFGDTSASGMAREAILDELRHMIGTFKRRR